MKSYPVKVKGKTFEVRARSQKDATEFSQDCLELLTLAEEFGKVPEVNYDK